MLWEFIKLRSLTCSRHFCEQVQSSCCKVFFHKVNLECRIIVMLNYARKNIHIICMYKLYFTEFLRIEINFKLRATNILSHWLDEHIFHFCNVYILWLHNTCVFIYLFTTQIYIYVYYKCTKSLPLKSQCQIVFIFL